MRRRAVLFVLSLSVFSIGCGDYRIDLPGDYSLVRVSGGGEFVITKNEGGTETIELGPTVERYAFNGSLIIGSLSTDGDNPEMRAYFLVDVQRETKTIGLDLEELKKQLSERDLSMMKMKRPNRFQALF